MTVTRVNEMQDLEVQIEVAGEGEAESVRSRVEDAIYRALSLRPKVTLAAPGTLARFELKARRFRRLD